MEGKNIKVYGTLINQTQNTNSSMRDSQHNDLIAVAYQLYDERFNPRKGSGTNFAVTAIDRYQDIINKRLTAIYFDDKGTGNTSDDITYIDSKLNVAGDSVFDGPVTFNNNVNITGNINLNIGLNDLNDVTLSTMTVGQVLRYDGSKWVNAKLSLSDIQMPAASNGQVLKFNGTEWVAGNDAGGVSRLSELQDVNISNPDNGAKLVYDAASGKWIAQGSGASGAVDISLGELNNVTEQNKQNSSVLIYDNTGGTWKPAMFGNSASSIGGLSVVQGDCEFTTVDNHTYPVVPMSIDIAKNVISCMITIIPKSGAVDTFGNAAKSMVSNIFWQQQYGGFCATGVPITDTSMFDCTYKYIMYQP